MSSPEKTVLTSERGVGEGSAKGTRGQEGGSASECTGGEALGQVGRWAAPRSDLAAAVT